MQPPDVTQSMGPRPFVVADVCAAQVVPPSAVAMIKPWEPAA
jgi:hypothetical protein